MKNHKITALIIALSLCACALASCTKKCGMEKTTAPATGAAAAPDSSFVIMEKTLSDQPGRTRTTMKIIIPAAKDAASAQAAIKASLDKIRADDPALKAAIIWAYRNRSELNASNFTAGKLEWSADGKDFNGATPLSPNPKIEAVAK